MKKVIRISKDRLLDLFNSARLNSDISIEDSCIVVETDGAEDFKEEFFAMLMSSGAAEEGFYCTRCGNLYGENNGSKGKEDYCNDCLDELDHEEEVLRPE